MATATKTPALSVSLEPSPQAAEGVSLLQQAQGISIIDKASHEVCRTFLKGAKALKRTIEEHYAKIKKPLNDARTTVLDMERQHLAPVLQAIALAEKVDTVYVREQEQRERDEADQRRRQAEAAEQLRRAVEAEQAEAEALKLEASSDVLSERERIVVECILKKISATGHLGPTDWLMACKEARYKDPRAAAAKLIESEKIIAAVQDGQKAAEIRRESEAAQAAPILLDVAPVESAIGSVAGTSMRSYYGAEVFDLLALVKAVAAGTVPLDALTPNMVHLNGTARSLKTLMAYPGVRVTKREGITG
jgi:hypothetical protein